MSATPLVTAIIPTKDRAQLCVRAVESVLAQTYTNLECIVVDDGSTDGTSELLTSRFGGRVRIIRHDVSQGVAKARNEAIRAARGVYVAFLDSDDEWLPEKTARQVHAAEKDAAVVYCRSAYVTPAGKLVSVQPRRGRTGDLSLYLLSGNHVGSLSGVLVRRSCFDGMEPFRGGIYSEDWHLWLRLAFRYRFAFVPDVLVRTEFNPSARHWSMSGDEMAASFNAIYDELEQDPVSRDAVRSHRGLCEATTSYYLAMHLITTGYRAEAWRPLLRSIRHRPLQRRVLRPLFMLLTGAKVTNAVKALLAPLNVRRFL